MRPSIYVAGSSREIERAERVIAALRSHGLRISHDWTAVMRCHGPDAHLADEVLLPCLRDDLEEGVFAAEHVLLLAPAPGVPTMGMWVELGAAWAHAMRIVSAGDCTACPWIRALVPAEDRFATDDEAIAHVVQLVRGAASAA